MGRQPKIRASYERDAQWILTLREAIERDERRPLAWRKKAMALGMEFSLLLLKAPPTKS